MLDLKAFSGRDRQNLEQLLQMADQHNITGIDELRRHLSEYDAHRRGPAENKAPTKKRCPECGRSMLRRWRENVEYMVCVERRNSRIEIGCGYSREVSA